MCGKEHPIEKVRDMETRTKVMYSTQPYAISEVHLCAIIDAEPE